MQEQENPAFDLLMQALAEALLAHLTKAQADYIKQATADGFVPFVANQSLDANIPSVNATIPAREILAIAAALKA